jgi:hypothetical protein
MAKSNPRFNVRPSATLPVFGALLTLSLFAPSVLRAQAGPGPIEAPQSQAQPSARSAPEIPKPKPPQLPPRTTLAGPWKLNRDDSDDPKSKVRAAEGSRKGNASGYPGGGYPGGGYPGGGYPGGGYPGGGYPGGGYPGGGYPGGGYPGGGYPGGGRNSGPDLEDNAKLQPLLRRSDSLNIVIKNPQIDITDDEFHILTLYTDGRQLPKQTDDSHVQVLAHWNGSQLVSDEKSPLGGNLSRTFELSPDGRELDETLHIDTGKSKTPITIRLVYSVSASDMQTGEDSDPDRPVLKRHSDDSNSSSPQ